MPHEMKTSFEPSQVEPQLHSARLEVF